MDANTLGYVMTLLSIGITWIAFKTSFFGMKLMAGIWWFIMFMYIKTEPPSAITEGSGLHTGILVICIGFGVMVVLSGLGRGIQRTQKWDKDGTSETSEGFGWKVPKWLKFQDTDYEDIQRQNSIDSFNYRMKLRQAYRRKEPKEGRR